MKLHTMVPALALGILCGVSFALAAPSGPAYESAPVLKASKILPARLLSGPLHKVKERVVNDGFINHYQVESKFGGFKAVSTLALAKLVREITAIDKMSQIEQSDVYAKSLKQSGKKTVDGIKHLFTDPSGTAQGAAKGMSSLFGRAGEAMFGSTPSQAEDSRMAQLLGYSASKRDVAASFGVDVYSANPVLQKYLDKLAMADYTGGLSVSAALAVVPGGAGLVVSASGGARLLNEVIRVTPPVELRKQNRAKLAKMGMDHDTSELFINNTIFSPRDQTILVAALEAMKGVQNRELFLKVALQAQNRDMAFLISTIAVLYAGYHKHVGTITCFYPVARVLYAQTKKGTILMAIPADYVAWTSRFAGGAGVMDSKAEKLGGLKDKEFWLLGRVSPTAAQGLKQAGWQVHPKCKDRLLPKAKNK